MSSVLSFTYSFAISFYNLSLQKLLDRNSDTNSPCVQLLYILSDKNYYSAFTGKSFYSRIEIAKKLYLYLNVYNIKGTYYIRT